MYRNKKDVDKHVESLMFKLSPKDFKTRAYSIARLYYEVGDYGSCQKYVEQYLTQKSNNAAAHKLLGQAFQKLGDKEKALEQYKTSYDIDPTQTSTILDVCELLADDDVGIDSGRAKYWCDKAGAMFPKHPVTFRLRERLLAVADPDPEALVKLLKTELEVRPRDAVLHARLLKHYIRHNKYKEAFDHSCNVEFDKNLFSNNFAWYETLSEIIKYNPLKTNDWLYQLLLLTIKEKLCLLGLTEVPSSTTKNLVECNDYLHIYDQSIEIVRKSGSPPGFGEFHVSLLKHHQGQLAFHIATFLLKKAKKDQLNWKEAKKISAPFMLLAWQTVPLDSKVNWLMHAPERQQNVIRRWYLEGSFRCSQSGHYLLSIIHENSQVLLDQISQLCSGTNWKDKLYEKIFTGPEQLAKIKSSYLTSNAFSIPSLRLPRKTEVQAYDDDAQREYPNSLHHFVWILLNYKKYADFRCTLFDMLTPTMTSCGPETLNKMDILAFLYCATLTAQKHIDKINYMSVEKPILPSNTTDLLCSLPQMKWWDCAYKLSQNELGVEYTDIRSTLSRGIEVVRCIDNHGLDPELLAILGGIFSELAKTTQKTEEKTNLEQRSYLYYSSAIPLLEKLKNRQVIKLPDKRMFDYTHEDLETKELNNLLEESKINIALHHLIDGEYEKVINLLSSLKSPQACYHLSNTYKKLALEEKQLSKSTDSEKKYIMFLEKAKYFAYKALDQMKEIEMNKNKTLYTDIQILIEEIESHLGRVDPDTSSPVNDEISDENVSDMGSLRFKTNLFKNTSSTPKQVARHNFNVNATTYRTATDSQIFENIQADQIYFERIEKQIRNLNKRDTTINDFMEQTKDWFEENRKLGNQIISTINCNIDKTTEQFEQLKISVDQVKEQVDECRKECKDVVELKKQIADLKKEVNKLKKTSSEQAIDESDLYNLDEEYRTNENPSTFNAHLPFTTPPVIPPFTQRLIPPFSVPSNPYQLYGQNFYNLYNQYSQFAQTSAVPGAPPIFDPTRAQMNYPGVYATPEQMYLDAANIVNTTLPAAGPVAPAPVPNIYNVPTVPPVSIAPPSIVPTSKVILDTKETKSLPVNVVITSSDPLPTSTTTPAPVLSVTIPQKHIKGSPHNYQIQMPPSSEAKLVAPPVFHFPSSDNKSNLTSSSSTSNWNAKTIFTTNQSQNPLSSLGSNDSLVRNLNDSKCMVDGVFTGLSPNTSLNKSRTLSERSNTSIENYDPCPDFKPIIPLPAEVKVTTGEEDEIVIFNARAKLFRFTDKQWKERGIGEMKLLKHKTTGKVRVLMRREQVHKICANHIISSEMEIKPMKNETKAYFWVANDFAEETVILEKFCIRFKTADIAKEYFEAFENARKECFNQISVATYLTENQKNISKVPVTTIDNLTTSQPQKTVVGGFTFSGKPCFKSTDNTVSDTKIVDTPTTKVNIFSGLTFKTTTSMPFSNILSVSTNSNDTSMNFFNKTSANANKLNSSDTVEEFEPTTEFEPVIPLPALVDQKTGEEDEIILFEHRAKLLRFDATGKEWKERGLGNIKLLLHKDNNQKLRLLMRREQIMKVCCNHAITKEMVFQKMPNMDKAVTWCAKDFSEGELVSETFCLRFKTVQACNDFIDAVKNAQTKIGDNTKAAKEEQNAAKQNVGTGFGDKFKPKPGSWTCETCYTNNIESVVKCACCETPKQKDVTAIKDTNVANNDKTVSNSSDWGAKFKPKAGSWECKECLIRNESDYDFCVACNSPRDPNTKKEVKSVTENTSKYNFLITGNNSNNQKNLNTSEQKFTFGIPQSDIVKSTDIIVTSSGFSTNTSQKFSFGIPQNKAVTFGVSVIPTAATPSTKIESESVSPINFSMKNKEEDKITVTPVKTALLSTPKTNIASFGKESGTFQFSFKPKTQSKGKSPSKSPNDKKGDDSDDNEYASEDEGHHIHFSPVIPMPDKIEVVTGEENEDELYSHRAKLFIFTNGEWKERGIGFVKILKHKETEKLRVVMRREQVHKICLNHTLGPDNIYKPKDEKSWCFVANDFSEGEIMLQNFCLRFQNKDVALQFKEAIDKSLSEKCNLDKTKDLDLDEECIFISEIQATNEEKQKAKELMLPENFYTYKSKEPCQGCRGCDDEEDIKPESDKLKTGAVFPKQDITVTPLKTSAFSFQSPSSSVYGTPNIFEKTGDTTIFRTPLSSNGSNTKIASPNTTTSSLLGNIITDKENTSTEKSQNPIKPVSFVSGNQSQSLSSVLAAPKLITTSADNEAAKPVFAFTEAKSIFVENKLAPSNKSIFGFNPQNKDNTQSTENKSIFSLDFKTGQTGGQSIFGLAASKISQPSSGIFGSTGTFTFGNPTQPGQENTKSFFGKSENSSIFNDKIEIPSSKPLEAKSNFEAPLKFTFGKNVILQNQETNKISVDSSITEKPVEKVENAVKNTVKENKDATPIIESHDATKEKTPFMVDNALSFAALSSSGPGFVAQKKSDFQWEGAGQQLFVSKLNENDDKSKTSGDADNSGAGAGAEEEYDPHYEPIVPLPDKIVVTTGEEDEVKLFGERCKLYRYDEKSREWKERGVGEMKVLYHSEKNSYRLLLRREQVHKAVLNMLIFKDLELLPMKNSDRAWTWCGRNYAEIAGEQETLAVRFKSVDLAANFHEKVMECVKKLQDKNVDENKGIAALRLPKHIEPNDRPEMSALRQSIETQPGTADKNGEVQKTEASDVQVLSEVEASKQVHFEEVQEDHGDYDDYEHGYDHNEDSDGYYNEEEESSTYYPCKAIVKQGDSMTSCENTQVQISFDQELCSPKILVTDSNTGEVLADMLIHTDTEFQLSEETCSWSGHDYTSNVAVESTLTVTFPDSDTAMEFYDSCETSKAATYASTDSES